MEEVKEAEVAAEVEGVVEAAAGLAVHPHLLAVLLPVVLRHRVARLHHHVVRLAVVAVEAVAEGRNEG